MRLKEKLDELVTLVESARGLPVSSSVIVNKAELIRLLDELRELLPEDLVEAQAVLERRDQILNEAVANAERLLTAAAEEQRRLVSETEVVQEARVEAGALMQSARGHAEQMARDIDKYVDAKLAHLEVSITKLLDTVRQGRERLAQPELYAELSALPEPPGELVAAVAALPHEPGVDGVGPVDEPVAESDDVDDVDDAEDAKDADRSDVDESPGESSAADDVDATAPDESVGEDGGEDGPPSDEAAELAEAKQPAKRR